MEQQDRVYRQQIEYFLNKMDYPPEHLQGYQILQGGISGAATYRLQMIEGEFVCKITRAQSEQYGFERAQREFLFYQQLAPRVPLRVPHVVAHVRDPQGTALLLSAYQPSPPASQWQEEDYVEAARQIGELHATFWKNTEQIAQCSWLQRRKEHISKLQVKQVEAQWQAMQEDAHFVLLIPGHRFQRVIHFLPLILSLENLLIPFPLTVCHGDCHSDNVLRDKHGDLVWADWQEVGVGIGPEDLSFFFQRAFHAGGAVPYEAMISTYHKQIEAQTRQLLPTTRLGEVLDIIEVSAWILQWPGYLRQTSPQQLLKVLDRVDWLIDRLHRIETTKQR